MQKKESVIIVAHRGYWLSEQEKNQRIAFERAFDNGYGIETDLRDVCGKIVISHDMPKGDEITFEEVLQIMNGRNLPLALNIKADGQAKEIKRLLEKYNHTNYFTFDMSIPEMVVQHRVGLNVFTGLSDIIKTPILFDKANGVWLDCFNSDWFGTKEIEELLEQNKKVCIVSPDLHKRPYKEIWARYRNVKNIMICTDYPKEAEEFFYDKN